MCPFIICVSQQDKISVSKKYYDLVRPSFTGETSYNTTAYVEKFWRVVGNSHFDSCIYHTAAKLEAGGFVNEDKATPNDRFTFRIEKRPLRRPTWEPVDAEVNIVGEKNGLLKFSTNKNMIAINSFSTPAGGIEAEVVYIKSVAELKDMDVKGKIVFGEMSTYRLFKPAVSVGGALGILAYRNAGYIQAEKNVNSITFTSIPYDDKSKGWGIALSYEAKESLKASLAKGKTQIHVKIKTKSYESEELTLIADIKGSVSAEERIVFSAHVQEPGANDNASGVATQLEMAQVAARLLKLNRIEVKRTITFLWGDEISSTNKYIKDDPERAKNIKWGISLDMVGENTELTGGSFLIEKMPDPGVVWIRGIEKHTDWGGRTMKYKDLKPHYLNDFFIHRFNEQGGFANWEVNTNPYEGGSDHVPFLRADIPGLLLWHFTDQFYHTDGDRMDKVSKKVMQNVGTAALVSALVLVNANEETGVQLITETKLAAIKRLNDEYELSKTAIKKSKNPDKEIEILEGWKNWYLGVFNSFTDLETGGPGINLKKAIMDARGDIKNHTKKLTTLIRNL